MNDPTLEPPQVNTSPNEDYSTRSRQWQGIPGIERAPNGRLWAVWYSGGTGEGPDNYVLVVTSDDDGETWSEPVVVVDPPGMVRAYDAALWLDPTNRLWLVWAQSYGWWDGRSGVWVATTEEPNAAEPSWSEPRRLCDGIMLNKPTVLSGGPWILPAAVWESEPRGKGVNESFLHDLGAQKGGNLYVSTDEGESWNLLGQTRVNERVFDEHMLIERKDGSLWTLVRTAYGIGESISVDGGKSWSEGKPSGITNANSRFHIRRLNSGRLLLVHHDPPGEFEGAPPRSHLTARLSDDDGKSWSGDLLIDERMGVSYPDAVETDTGVIYLIYDYSRHDEMEILMATFTEEDILAGDAVSDAARLRVLVNKAAQTG